MLTVCEEDNAGYYFDEFGGGLEGTSSKKAPLENVTDETIGVEELITFEEFANIAHEGTFIPSQEDSDIEPEVDTTVNSSHQISQQAGSSSDDEISAIPDHLCIKPRPKKHKWCKSKIDPRKCASMEIEHVDAIPWDVDGDHKYRLLAEPDQWIDKTKDGHWYKMNTSSNNALNGFRKTVVCSGSILCQNIGCSKLQTEGVLNSNPSDFTHQFGCHVCKCCGFFTVEINCGCKKEAEYNLDTKEVTVCYEGEHNCTPKPDVKAKINFFENLPLQSSLCLTACDTSCLGVNTKKLWKLQ